MQKYEYIKWYWKHPFDSDPVLLFYEVDLENERYASRMTEVFIDRSAIPVTEDGFEFITEAPVPTVCEINVEPDSFAELISKEEFEAVYRINRYTGNICFPK